jgi:hypothetical protein
MAFPEAIQPVISREARAQLNSPLLVSTARSRVRWLRDHDVYTEYLDAGIGGCWFAYRGAHEPVRGETEADALARLDREHGLELCREPAAESVPRA